MVLPDLQLAEKSFAWHKKCSTYGENVFLPFNAILCGTIDWTDGTFHFWNSSYNLILLVTMK